MAMSTQTLAKLSALYAGLAFGVYWIPLRALEDAGIGGAWAAVALIGAPLVLVSPFLLYRWRGLAREGFRFHVAGGLAGAAFALYATSFLFTDVVRSVLLFYLTPVWGFLLARVAIGDAITPVRWISIGLGIAGMLIIFGLEEGSPLPRNAGDWMALAAGVLWAIGSLMMLTDPRSDAVNYTGLFLGYGALLAAAIATLAATHPAPSVEALWSIAPWFAPVVLFVVVPSSFAAIYSPTILNPGVVGLFFMIEVSVATVTAALFADEPFGAREAVGAAAVMSAGLLEPILDLRNAHARAS